MSGMSKIECAKKVACYAAIDAHITPETRIVSIGSGSTIPYALDRLKKSHPQITAYIPTSHQSLQLIVDAGLPLSSLNQYPRVDVAIDGADEVDGHFDAIKGGGACMLQEKVVAASASVFVVVADYTKESPALGTLWKSGVPMEVCPTGYASVIIRVREEFGGVGRLRMAVNKAGPVVTDNGNFVVDVDFGVIQDPALLEAGLIRIPGVLETGLFCGMIDAVYYGMEDGSVKCCLRDQGDRRGQGR